MNWLLSVVISVALSGLGVWLMTRVVPGVTLRNGFKSAIVAGVVYGILKTLLFGILFFFSLPLVLVTFGLFVIVINAALLGLTDKLVDNIHFKSIGALVLGTLFLSVFDFLCEWIIGRGAIF